MMTVLKNDVVTILPDGRMDAKSASVYLGYTEKALAMMRYNKTGPIYVKPGRIFYYKHDLDEWIIQARSVNGKKTASSHPKKSNTKKSLPLQREAYHMTKERMVTLLRKKIAHYSLQQIRAGKANDKSASDYFFTKIETISIIIDLLFKEWDKEEISSSASIMKYYRRCDLCYEWANCNLFAWCSDCFYWSASIRNRTI